MNNDNKKIIKGIKKCKERKCKDCYNKFSKKEMVLRGSGFYCEPCARKVETIGWVGAIVQGLVIGALWAMLLWAISKRRRDE